MFETVILPIFLIIAGGGLGWVAKENNAFYRDYLHNYLVVLSAAVLTGITVWNSAITEAGDKMLPITEIQNGSAVNQALDSLKFNFNFALLFILGFMVYLQILFFLPHIRHYLNDSQTDKSGKTENAEVKIEPVK